MNRSGLLSMAALGLTLAITTASPMGAAYAQQEEIYGSQLMTQQDVQRISDADADRDLQRGARADPLGASNPNAGARQTAGHHLA